MAAPDPVVKLTRPWQFGCPGKRWEMVLGLVPVAGRKLGMVEQNSVSEKACAALRLLIHVVSSQPLCPSSFSQARC